MVSSEEPFIPVILAWLNEENHSEIFGLGDVVK
jgi:hypothetical protein